MIMTDENKTEQLLSAFYNGDTTVEEENFLTQFFNSERVNEKWHTDRELFHVLYDPSRISLPEGFPERLETAIDNHIKETTNRKSISKTRKLYLTILSAAAVVLLCIRLLFNPFTHSSFRHFTLIPSNSDLIADTYTNPEEAAIAAEQALRFVSAKLNQGLSPLEKVKESINKTNEIINENVSIY
jgi:hypothetical protein